MRHLLANLTVYIIGTLIFLGAGLFAWVRSAQVVLSDESTVVADYAPTTEQDFEWQALGRNGYVRNCANCHLRDGSGWDQYPGLAGTGNAHRFGRERFIDLHLDGLDTDRWRVPMPPMAHIPDPELAAILNYVVTQFGGADLNADDAEPFLPDDVRRRRDAARE